MRLGRYNVVSVLGHGAFGEVFHARLDGPMGFTKDVAVKRLHPHLVRGDPAIVQALVDEARLGGLLRHPNIVESYAFEEADGTWLLAMEFVDGITLQELANIATSAGQPLPTAAALELVEQVCAGLAYAHTLADPNGVPLRLVHRDLKPANLMLSREGVVKIMDFGMAKASSNLRDSTASGTVKGTPAYMSPEQVHATRAVSPASDVYAVGVMLWELLTGRRLFEAETAVAVMFAVIQGIGPAAVETLDARLPGAGPVFARAVAPNPDDRWRSAEELGRAVRGLREGLTEPAGALRAIAVGLLQGRGDDVDRSEELRSWLVSASGSWDRMRVARARPIVAPESDATRDAARDPDATRDATQDPDATRDERGRDVPGEAAVGAADPDATRDAVSRPGRGGTTREGGTGETTASGRAESETGTAAGGGERLGETAVSPGAPAGVDPGGVERASDPISPTTSPRIARPPRGPLYVGLGLLAALAVGVGAWTLRPDAAVPPAAAPSPEPIATPSPASAPANTVTPAASAPAPPPAASPSPPPSDPAPGAPASKRPSSTPPTRTPSPTTKSAEPAVTAPVAVGTGSLLVKASPWGRVTIDGAPAGQTPLRRKVPAGRHTVVVECGECAVASSRTFDVTVPADGTETVNAEFSP